MQLRAAKWTLNDGSYWYEYAVYVYADTIPWNNPNYRIHLENSLSMCNQM